MADVFINNYKEFIYEYDSKNREAYENASLEDIIYNTYNPNAYIYDPETYYPEPEETRKQITLEEKYNLVDLRTKLIKLPVCDERFKSFTLGTMVKLNRISFNMLIDAIDSCNLDFILKVTGMTLAELHDFIEVVRKYYKDESWLK